MCMYECVPNSISRQNDLFARELDVGGTEHAIFVQRSSKTHFPGLNYWKMMCKMFLEYNLRKY